MDVEPPRDLDFFLALALAYHFSMSVTRREFEAAGVEMYMWGLLVHIDAHGRATPTQLAAETGVTQTTIRDQVQALVDRGLVTRAPNPEDGRSYTLELTRRGRADLKRGRVASRRAQSEIEREFGQSLDDFRDDLLDIRAAAARAGIVRFRSK